MGPYRPQALKSRVWKNPLNLYLEPQTRKLHEERYLQFVSRQTYVTQGIGSLLGTSAMEQNSLSVGGIIVRLNHMIWGEFEAIVKGINVNQGSYSLGLAVVPFHYRFLSRTFGVGLMAGMANYEASYFEGKYHSGSLYQWSPYWGSFLSLELSYRLSLFLQSKYSPTLGYYSLFSFSADI
jgi:hypothetical protein